MDYFSEVKSFSFFIAPSRSGHSVIAHLLSAHPEVLFSDELDALMWLDEGFSPEQVFALIKYQNQRYGRPGKTKSGYSYQIPNSWQYRWDKRPSVVGDSKGRQSALRVAEDESFVPKLRDTLGMPLRVFVQARHPYAIVASEMRNRGWDVRTAVARVIEEIETIDAAIAKLHGNEQLLVYHEDVMRHSADAFRRMFSFLGVAPDSDIVDQCAQKTWTKPRTTAFFVAADDQRLTGLRETMERSRLFSRYLSDSEVALAGLPGKSESMLKRTLRHTVQLAHKATAAALRSIETMR